MRLEDREKIILRVHPHWLYVTIPEFALAIFGIIFFAFGRAVLPRWTSILFAFALSFAMLMVF